MHLNPFQETGWIPRHIIAKDESESILGVVPLYLKRFSIFCALQMQALMSFLMKYVQKFWLLLLSLLLSDLFDLVCSHSYGEFVFDHSWADAYYSFGSRYYPKLQCCVPFTPVTGPRILIRDTSFRDQVFDALVSALKDLTAKVLSNQFFKHLMSLLIYHDYFVNL